MPAFQDLTGQRFGKLIAIERVENSKAGKTKWLCKCDCGLTVIAHTSNLRTRHTVACPSCFYHGQTGTPTYYVWRGIKKRCLDPKSFHYKNYGGRGITICDRWLKFKNFYEDMGEKPKGMSIDRIDNNGNYEPGNCRWATDREQANNRRNNRLIKFEGKTQTLTQWADQAGMQGQTLKYRIDRIGLAFEDALQMPLKKSDR